MKAWGIGWSIAVVVVLLALVLAVTAGCGESGGDPTTTTSPSPTDTAIVSPRPSPEPTEATETAAWNIARNLSGLDITLTLTHWTGDDLRVEWVIANRSGQRFEREVLDDIFSLGAVAVDQDGNEGEYYIPEPFTRNLQDGQTAPYETRWVFFPESRSISLRLWDFREAVAGSVVESSVDFKFFR
jgi:hypothetical protein